MKIFKLLYSFYLKKRAKLIKNTIINCKIIPTTVIHNIGSNVFLNKECQIYKESVKIGDYSYINGGKIFYAEIGKFCSIGYNIVFGAGEHYTTKVTTYPINSRICQQNMITDFPDPQNCIIGNAVWIGNNVTIMQNVKIGDGAIIASGAVVTHDVEPFTIVAGIPAKKIKTLHTQNDINFLLNSAWWNWPTHKIIKAIQANAFENINNFKYYCNLNNI